MEKYFFPCALFSFPAVTGNVTTEQSADEEYFRGSVPDMAGMRPKPHVEFTAIYALSYGLDSEPQTEPLLG